MVHHPHLRRRDGLTVFYRSVLALTRWPKRYIAIPMFRVRRNNKLMFSVMALCIAVAVCSIDHVSPMNGAADHAHTAAPGCIPNLCVTMVSQDAPLSGKTGAFFLLLSVLLISGFTPHLPDTHPHNRTLLVSANHFPRASNKLYRLHAVYLL